MIIKSLNNWKDIKQSALTTIDKKVVNDPDFSWKLKLLISEHSPIRRLRVSWKWENIKSWVSVHFVRHKIGIIHFVKSQRDDITGIDRDSKRQDELVNHECDANAQAIINISRKRLCYKAHPETRKLWEEFKKDIEFVEPELYMCMVPECIYRFGCPEFKTCGYFKKFKETFADECISNMDSIEKRYDCYDDFLKGSKI